MPPNSRRTLDPHERTFAVRPPFRLDLTVAVLRRLSTNLVDRFTDEGCYLRALRTSDGAAAVEAWMEDDRLVMRLHGVRGDAGALAQTVCRMLGIERSTAVFDRGAAGLPWLAPLAARMRGVRPPRYPTLWEAIVNAVLFQQISIHAAGAILGRLVERCGPIVRLREHRLCEFPPAERILALSPAEFRVIGLSTGKAQTLERAAAAIEAGLDERTLEALETDELMTRLRQIKGIGPWTAAIIALRGFGRLDLFPQGDSGIAHSLRAIAGEAPEMGPALAALGAERAMLYYFGLLGRLEAQRAIGVTESTEAR